MATGARVDPFLGFNFLSRLFRLGHLGRFQLRNQFFDNCFDFRLDGFTNCGFCFFN